MQMGQAYYTIASFPETRIVFFVFLRKTAMKFYTLVYLKLHTGSGIALYVSYIHSRTMYVVPMERA